VLILVSHALHYNYSIYRYTPLEGATKAWDDAKTPEENQKQFSWVPGIAFRPSREAQLREVLKDHPKVDHIVEAIKELHEWLRDGGCLARGEAPPGSEDWAIAYDLQPNKPFPER
jgi:hypothetical protein